MRQEPLAARGTSHAELLRWCGVGFVHWDRACVSAEGEWMTPLDRLDALINRGVFYDCDWETLKAVRDELAKRGSDDE